MNINDLLREAGEAGFPHCAGLKVETLRFLPQVRDMCSSDRCHNYNRSWSCPPACGTLEECAARAKKFSRGVIVQSVGTLEDPFDYESMKALSERHKDRFEAFVLKLRKRYPGLLAMGAGGCTLCGKCSYPDAPCRFPDRAFVSMEACGLWVSDVCEKNGIAYNYGPDKMAYTSCILID